MGIPRYIRNYDRAPAAAAASAPTDRDAAMARFVDRAWDAFGGDGEGRGISWIGFYAHVSGAQGDEMVLLHRRDKPACSPIGLHGMCGKSFLDRRPILVDDVRTLGNGYIACDPRDLSELVIPLFEADGTCWGVLDADSYDTAAFSEADIAGFGRWLVALGLTPDAPDLAATLRL